MYTVSITGKTDYYPFGLKHKGYGAAPIGVDHKYGFGGKEEQDDNLGGNQLNWLDFGARNYDAALGRWMNLDPVAEMEYSLTPYRYAFNNPINVIDPDGMYEWRVNSDTGAFELVGFDGDDKTQHIFWNDDKKSTASVKGSKIYIGAVSKNNFSDGEVTYGVSNVDLWSDLPDEYQGAYNQFALTERYEAKKEGGDKYNSILAQESQGKPRRDQIWNNSDYGRHLDNKYGSRSGFVLAAETGILKEMFDNLVPGIDEIHGVVRSQQKSLNNFSPGFKKVEGGFSKLSNNSWIRFLQVNKNKYKGLGTDWVKKAASDYHKLKKDGKL